MRHGKKFNHLGRTASHRKAMLSNMASSLILHKRITTTLPKAKELRKYVEPLITRSKEDTTHARQVVFSYLQDKHSSKELFNEVSHKIGDRPGGYTRIIKLGNRQGDDAEMCLIELVDYNELLLEEAKPKAKSTRRSRSRRGGGKQKQTSPQEETAAVESSEEANSKDEEQKQTEGAAVEATEDSEQARSGEQLPDADNQSDTVKEEDKKKENNGDQSAQ